MKIYAVVDNVDLGYHVIKAFYHLKDAEEEMYYLINKKHEKLIENYTTCPDIDGRTKTYDEAVKYVDYWFNWTQYTIEEIEVE